MDIRRLLLFIVAVPMLSLGGQGAPAVGAPPAALPAPGPCVEGRLRGGALSLVCVPAAGWNGDALFWAHGYVAPQEPLSLAHLTLPDGTYLPDLVQRLGFAFATTSYRSNGLVVLEAVEDMRELVAAYRAIARPAPASRTYLAGASEGGLISVLLAERTPELFSGVLAACGPVGDFRAQLNYWGDFRLLFDYFFPGVLPGSPFAIPQELIDGWDTVYRPRVEAALAANPSAARQLIATSGAPIVEDDPQTVISTTLGLLWYNVFATNEGTARLKGNPYDNRTRWYSGSADDLRLNLTIPRYRADSSALAEVARYETSGQPAVPLVVPHTLGDEIVPAGQTVRYWFKAQFAGRGGVLPLLIPRYGHCNFTTVELLVSFGLLVLQVSGQPQPQIERMTGVQIDLATAQEAFERQRTEYVATHPEEAATFSGGRVYLPLIRR